MAGSAQMCSSLARAWRRWWVRHSRRAPGEPRELGAWGEARAEWELRRRRIRLLKRNFRAPHGGEADLVVRDGGVLAFVEVKTRRSLDRGRPAGAVDADKRRLIERAAWAWLRMLGEPAREIAWRIDVVEVIVGEDGRVGEIRWNKGG